MAQGAVIQGVAHRNAHAAYEALIVLNADVNGILSVFVLDYCLYLLYTGSIKLCAAAYSD